MQRDPYSAEKRTVIGVYHLWTETGLECYRSKQDCDRCAVRVYGFHRDTNCYQPEAIAQLLANGIRPLLRQPRREGRDG